MPYYTKKEGNKTCVYKKSDDSKVGCTTGDVKKYLAALHANDVKNEMLHIIDSLSLDELLESISPLPFHQSCMCQMIDGVIYPEPTACDYCIDEAEEWNTNMIPLEGEQPDEER